MKAATRRQQEQVSKKKKNAVILPQHMIENESLELVASPIGPIRTNPVSASDAQIILDRMSREIVDKFGFTLSPVGNAGTSRKRKIISTRTVPIDDAEEKKQRLARIAKSRIIIGTNSCTRAFEKLYSQQKQKQNQDRDKDQSTLSYEKPGSSEVVSHSSKPSLCILARNVRPPSILAHIPYLCHQMNVPIILLPGKASNDLGSILGGRKVAVLLFRERPPIPDGECAADKKHHDKIDSYVEFAKLKLPRF